MADITITTVVPSFKSSLPGQLTDFISERTSRKKRLTFSNFIISPIKSSELCAGTIIMLAGQAGIEPATPGFGDRCSTS